MQITLNNDNFDTILRDVMKQAEFPDILKLPAFASIIATHTGVNKNKVTSHVNDYCWTTEIYFIPDFEPYSIIFGQRGTSGVRLQLLSGNYWALQKIHKKDIEELLNETIE